MKGGSLSSLLSARPGVVKRPGFRAGGWGESWLCAYCGDCYFRGIASNRCSDETGSFFILFLFVCLFVCLFPVVLHQMQNSFSVKMQWEDLNATVLQRGGSSTLPFLALGPWLAHSATLQKAGAVPFRHPAQACRKPGPKIKLIYQPENLTPSQFQLFVPQTKNNLKRAGARWLQEVLLLIWSISCLFFSPSF